MEKKKDKYAKFNEKEKVIKEEYKEKVKDFKKNIDEYKRSNDSILYSQDIKNQQKEVTKAKTKELGKLAVNQTSKVYSKVGNVLNRLSKEKILKKPHAEIPKLNSTKFISQLARSQGDLVNEVPEREITQDNRSLFFNSEFNQEKRDIFKWLKD